MKHSWVYILEYRDGSYYTGCTSNLEQRIAQHEQGYFDGYTATRLPVKYLRSQEFADIRYAEEAEWRIKRWSRAKKEALMRGDYELLHQLAECKNKTHFKNKIK
ncbi:MAG: GIY-YIG nuclease family protein [Bacteroidota bacterium]